LDHGDEAFLFGLAADGIEIVLMSDGDAEDSGEDAE